MTVYLHAGTTKTGTTTIQRFLADNRGWMAGQGFVVPEVAGAANHTKLAAYALAPDQQKPVRRELGLNTPEEVEAFRAGFRGAFARAVGDRRRNYLFTNEHCSAVLHSVEELTVLRDLLASSGHEVRVLLYVREPAEYLASSYSTALKNGAHLPLKRPSPHALETKYNYLSICRRWSQVFGRENLTVRLFERQSLLEGNILLDFLQALGIDPQQAPAAARAPQTANRSLDYLVAGFLQEFNEHLAEMPSDISSAYRGDLAELCEGLSHRESILVPKPLRRFLYGRLQDDMATFAAEFLGLPAEWPFPPYREAGRQPVRKPDLDEAYALMTALWIAKTASTQRRQPVAPPAARPQEPTPEPTPEPPSEEPGDAAEKGMIARLRGFWR